jgi:hypothetical protein
MTPTKKNRMTVSILDRIKQSGPPAPQQKPEMELDPNEPGISPEERKRRLELQGEMQASTESAPTAY